MLKININIIQVYNHKNINSFNPNLISITLKADKYIK